MRPQETAFRADLQKVRSILLNPHPIPRAHRLLPPRKVKDLIKESLGMEQRTSDRASESASTSEYHSERHSVHAPCPAVATCFLLLAHLCLTSSECEWMLTKVARAAGGGR